ncbi:hypothetical protein DL96DRAFT_1644796 [Flagelloscypha sp. PMI_526]|nr:hypothetical protein DL96DRAFT_1644796 [Flagelloscypha sp. PMI_526]
MLLNLSSSDDETAPTVDRAGFWLGFVLFVVISSIEAVASVVWTRIRVTFHQDRPCELSYRVFGREIFNTIIDAETATEIANNGMPVGISCRSSSSVTHSYGGSVAYGSVSSMIHSEWETVTYHSSRSTGCSCCGGFETQHSSIYGLATEAVIDKFFSIMLVPMLLIRRFNPMTSLQAPKVLANNIKELVWPSMGRSLGRTLEHLIHLLVSLTDVALGIAGLVMVPGSTERLYNTLKDVEAPLTFEHYLTLFLLSWMLGALRLVFKIPLRSSRRSIRMFGMPATIVFAVASLANPALFVLGCWKIDHARRTQQPWKPMLSYWIGCASTISFTFCGVEVFEIFGVIGLILMLKHTV